MAFLALVAVLIGVGITVVVIRHRGPRSMDASIGQFSRGLDAIAPRARRFRRRK